MGAREAPVAEAPRAAGQLTAAAGRPVSRVSITKSNLLRLSQGDILKAN